MRINKFFHSQYWRFFIRFVFTVVILITLFVIGAVILIQLKKEWIIQQLVSYVNTQQAGEIEIASADLIWFQYLPNVAVEINDLNYFEHPSARRTLNEKSILHADHIYMALNAWSFFLESRLEVSEAHIQNAVLSLEEDAAGVLNIKKALVQTRSKEKQDTNFNLEYITADSVLIQWKSNSWQQPSVFLMKELKSKIRFVDQIITCQLQSTQELKAFYIKSKLISDAGEVSTDIQLQYDPSKKFLSLDSGTLTYKQLNIALKGFYDHENDQALEVYVDASSNEFALLSFLVKENIVKRNAALLKHGKIDVHGKIFGKLKSGRPQIEFGIEADSISMTLPDQLGEFKDVGFNGTFHSGEADDFSQAIFEMQNLHGHIPGGSIAGTVRVQNFKTPTLRYHLRASARLDGLDNVFNIGGVKDLKGKIAIQSDFEGKLNFSNPNPPLKPVDATITFDKVAFTIVDTQKKISDAHGKIVAENYGLKIHDLGFLYDSSQVQISGTVNHIYALLFNHETNIDASLNILSNQLFTRHFISDTLLTAKVQDEITKLRLAITLSTTIRELRTKKGFPDFDFEIKNLYAQFKKLPDIQLLTSSGKLQNTTSGIILNVDKFHCNLPHGSIAVQGDLHIPQKNVFNFNAAVKLNQFPTPYLSDLIQEIKSDSKPKSKNMANEKMNTLTADLKLSASMLGRPFAVKTLIIEKSKADLRLVNASHFSTEMFTLNLQNLFFNYPNHPDSSVQVKSMWCDLTMNQLKLPGIGKTNLHFKAQSANDPGTNRITLEDALLQLTLPKGSFVLNGDLAIPKKNTLNIDARISLHQFPWTNFEEFVTLFQSPGEAIKRNESLSKVKINSADLNLDASIFIKPFGVKKLEAKNSMADIHLLDSVDLQTGMFNLNLDALYFDHSSNTSGAGLKSVTANVNFDSLVLPVFGKTKMNLKIDGLNDQLKIGFATNILHAKKDEGELNLDLHKQPLEYHIRYSMEKMPTEYASQLLNKKASLKGPINIQLDLQGANTNRSLLESLKGTTFITGEGLTLYGVDVDKFLKNYKKSQNFNLVDVAAYIVVGVYGPLITKGSDFAKLATTNNKDTDKTDVVQLVVKGILSKGQIITDDVAFSTPSNRIAINGAINFIDKTIPGVRIAVIDKKGCSLLDQRLYGDFSHIQYGKLNVAGTIFGSVTNLANEVADKDCKPVYQGSVVHPKKK